MSSYKGAPWHQILEASIAAKDASAPARVGLKPRGNASHGTILKLHRPCSCGEVSIAQVQLQLPENLLIAGFGMAFAIITLP